MVCYVDELINFFKLSNNFLNSFSYANYGGTPVRAEYSHEAVCLIIFFYKINNNNNNLI